jgi:hypothetical protein
VTVVLPVVLLLPIGPGLPGASPWSATPAAAQEAPRGRGALLPEVRHFRMPLADPMSPRIFTGLTTTSLLATQGGERPRFNPPNRRMPAREWVATVGIGGIFPLVRLAEWEGGGAVLSLDGRVFGRFRVEHPTRDDMGQDWYVGGAVEAARHRWSGRLAVIHRSSHLGDEFVEATGARRIEFGSEQLDVLAAYEAPGAVRLYGGGAWIFRSYLRWDDRLEAMGIHDRALVQLGADGEWQPWADPRFHVLAGAEYYTAERSGWRPALSAVAGIGVRETRSLQLKVRAFSGPSHMGQFFLTDERYMSVELSAGF